MLGLVRGVFLEEEAGARGEKGDIGGIDHRGQAIPAESQAEHLGENWDVSPPVWVQPEPPGHLGVLCAGQQLRMVFLSSVGILFPFGVWRLGPKSSVVCRRGAFPLSLRPPRFRTVMATALTQLPSPGRPGSHPCRFCQPVRLVRPGFHACFR